MKYSIITWIDVNDQLPDLKKNVLVLCKSGEVRWGMRCEFTNERKVNGKIESTTKIEWGYEENDWEYWYEIDDVIMWAEFPDPEKILSSLFEQCLREEFLLNTQNYPKEYHKLFIKKFESAERRFREQSGK